LAIYPIPAREILNFKFSILNSGNKYSLVIFNSAGEFMQEIAIPEGQNAIRYNIESYRSGVYFIILKEGEKIIGSNRFIKID